MTDDVDHGTTVTSNPKYVDSLNDLVADLVRVELAATPVVEGSAVDANYRSQLQELVTSALREEGTQPDLHGLLTSALDLWVAPE